MTIFLDFDGTLLDQFPRLIAAHRKALGTHPMTITPDAYWALKQGAVPESEILDRHYPDVPAEEYLQTRLSLLETPELLAEDRLFPDALESLRTLRAGHDLMIVTVRAERGLLDAQVEALDLTGAVSRVLTAPSGSAPWEVKAGLMRPYAKPGDWIIGDTEADIRGGKLAGIHTCGVTSGIRSAAYLQSLEPDLVVPGIAEAARAILALRT